MKKILYKYYWMVNNTAFYANFPFFISALESLALRVLRGCFFSVSFPGLHNHTILQNLVARFFLLTKSCTFFFYTYLVRFFHILVSESGGIVHEKKYGLEFETFQAA